MGCFLHTDYHGVQGVEVMLHFLLVGMKEHYLTVCMYSSSMTIVYFCFPPAKDYIHLKW
jgi:hypothetical protein